MLVSSDKGVCCFIHLHKLFTVGVTLSTENFGELFEIGVNDIENSNFRIWNHRELILSTNYRPLLHFRTEKEANEFEQLERSQSFNYESSNGFWKLFASSGRDIETDVQQIVDSLVPFRTEAVSARLIEEYWLNEELFLRPVGSNLLVQVLSIRLEHTCRKL